MKMVQLVEVDGFTLLASHTCQGSLLMKVSLDSLHVLCARLKNLTYRRRRRSHGEIR